MPRQETFFEQSTGDVRVEVIKTYDPSYARDVFNGLAEDARTSLAHALELDKNYAPEDIPEPQETDYDDLIWQELYEAAREDVRNDPNLYSFFVVAETRAGRKTDLYVSPDWPSAQAYAKSRLGEAPQQSPNSPPPASAPQP
jgi:hypothetical protein